MLLELLSHQNFADMRYGLDPRFRFTVSRAIYKGMLKFIALQYNQPFVVQPLPVDHFSVRFTGAEEVELGWQAVRDSLEPTAVANKYILYTRKGNADFDNGVVVTSNKIRLHQEPGIIYSYKVTALNEGGESFPSEVLSACRENAIFRVRARRFCLRPHLFRPYCATPLLWFLRWFLSISR